MPKIKNMGHATVRFSEGTIITGSAGTDIHALVVTGSTVMSGAIGQPALDIYGNVSGQYVAVIDNDENSSGHVLKLLTDGNGSGSRLLEMEDGDGDTIFRARADGRFGFGPGGVSSMGAGTFVVGIDNSSHTADIAISQRLQHLGDSNTYLDFPSNDNITFAAGGSEELKIASDAILVKNLIKHDGDEDTLINFSDDKIILKAGNIALVTAEKNSSAPHEVTINDGSNNVDFVVKGNGSNQGNPGMKFDASTNKLGINGIGTPAYELEVAGNIGLAEYIYHRGDDNTHVQFLTDQINLIGGGKNMINVIGSGAGKRVLIVSGGAANSPDESTGSDICFYVSGSIDSATTSEAGASLFGGDIVASGSITTKFGLGVEGYIGINKESATPSQPPDGQGYLYSKTDGKLYWRSHDVSETDLTSGGGGGGGSTAKATYLGFISLQTTSRVVSFDLGASLAGTANNNIKGMVIAPFDGILDTIIVSTKGVNVSASNTGNVAVTAYLNQNNFAIESATVGLAPSDFAQKASGTPNIYSAVCDFNLSVNQGDLLQFKLQKDVGSNTDTLVTIVLTES